MENQSGIISNVAALFADGDRRYGILAGEHEGKAVVSGATEVFHVEPKDLNDAKPGSRIYFNADGNLDSNQVTAGATTAAPKEATSRAGGSGCASYAATGASYL